MQINHNKIYTLGKYSYENFCQLSDEDLLEILTWRNHPSIRNCMNNTDPISEEDHLSFCSTLRNRVDKYYWLVRRNNEKIGVLNIIDVDRKNKLCEPGFYLSPHLMGRGQSLFFLSNYKTFLLKELGFEGLIGHNYYDNMSALIFTMFFGAKITDIYNINGRLSIQTILYRNSFRNGEGTEKLIKKYTDYIRKWDVNDVIKQYRDGK